MSSYATLLKMSSIFIKCVLKLSNKIQDRWHILQFIIICYSANDSCNDCKPFNPLNKVGLSYTTKIWHFLISFYECVRVVWQKFPHSGMYSCHLGLKGHYFWHASRSKWDNLYIAYPLFIWHIKYQEKRPDY